MPALTMNQEPQKLNNYDTIRFGNQAAFTGKFKVALVFPNQPKPTKVDIVVRKNNLPTTSTVANNNNVKVFKTDITTFPTSFTVTAAELTALFGPIALNDAFDFAPDIYVNGKKYEAFPAVGIGTGAGVASMSNIGFYEFARMWTKN